ncbi:MAG TPA: hypothetical protein DCO77_05010 [Nitrospiraceae bacterium]|nr:hypothetical protein [Nitrospiraceae bacterium]
MTAGYLVFLLSGWLFGVPLGGALEIIPRRRSRRVPLAYSYVQGLIDYRGTIYPVFNLAQRLSLKVRDRIGFSAEEEQGGPEESMLLLEVSKNPFAIEVDRVSRMTKFDALAPSPAEAAGVDVQYIKGLAYEQNDEIIILDFERLFFHGS